MITHLQEVTIEEIHEVRHQIDRAIGAHNEWLMAWHRCIICKTPLGETHLTEDSYTRCRFGQWYYEQVNPKFKTFDHFLQIANIHKRMHLVGRDLALKIMGETDNLKVPPLLGPDDYDSFLDIRNEFRQKVQEFDKDLQNILLRTDPLTRVLNRSSLDATLERIADAIGFTGAPCVVAMVDLDHFKSVNDTYGHQIGDLVLQETAKFFVANLRPQDLVFRYGGEEFLVCLPHTALIDAEKVLDRLRERVSKTPILLPNGRGDLYVTGSIGVAPLSPHRGIKESIAMADAAVYQAKARGRNRVVCAEH